MDLSLRIIQTVLDWAAFEKNNAPDKTPRHSLAIAQFNRSLELSPNNVEDYTNGGYSLLALLQTNKAMTAFKASIATESKFQNAQVNNPNASADFEHKEQGLLAQEQSVTIAPNNNNCLGSKLNRGVCRTNTTPTVGLRENSHSRFLLNDLQSKDLNLHSIQYRALQNGQAELIGVMSLIIKHQTRNGKMSCMGDRPS